MVIVAGGLVGGTLDQSVEIDIEDAHQIVGAFDIGPQTVEPERLIMEHGAKGHATEQVAALLDPRQERAATTKFQHLAVKLAQTQPSRVDHLPHLTGNGAAHRSRVLAGGIQTGVDAGGILRVERHVGRHIGGVDLAPLSLVGIVAPSDQERRGPITLFVGACSRQQRVVTRYIQHARSVLGPLNITGHPIEVRCGARKHGLLLKLKRVQVPRCLWCHRPDCC